MQKTLENLTSALEIIASKLDNISNNKALNIPKSPTNINFATNYIGIWKNNAIYPSSGVLNPNANFVYGQDDKFDKLDKNIQSFIHNKPYSNVLLTGARGMGKSSLVALILDKYKEQALRLIQVNRKDLDSLDELFLQLEQLQQYKFIVYLDDLSFEKNDVDYKILKSMLDNGLNLIGQNTCIIATSNRKHLLPESMADNLEGINTNKDLRPGETLEESLSLADRFGLWLGFYSFNQTDYLTVVEKWLEILSAGKLTSLDENTRLDAINFATIRGVRNGRIAKHFATNFIATNS